MIRWQLKIAQWWRKIVIIENVKLFSSRIFQKYHYKNIVLINKSFLIVINRFYRWWNGGLHDDECGLYDDVMASAIVPSIVGSFFCRFIEQQPTETILFCIAGIQDEMHIVFFQETHIFLPYLYKLSCILLGGNAAKRLKLELPSHLLRFSRSWHLFPIKALCYYFL